MMQIRRRITDMLARHALLAATLVSGLLVVIIGIALLVRSRTMWFGRSLGEVLFSTTFAPESGQFGLGAYLAGTVWVTGLATVLAVPICLLAAIYLAEFAGPRLRAVVKPLIDLLAGIPSVVYGVWGVLVVVPFIADRLAPFAARHWAKIPLLQAEEYAIGYSVLAGAVVLAIMISPVIVAIADEVLRAVPAEYREASYALGATRFETITRVVARKALPGLVAAVVLGISRALGETMAVLMVVGNLPLVPRSIFDQAYPLPALIANKYGELMSLPEQAAALLGAALLLLLVVLAFNILARVVLAHAMRRAA